MTEPRCAKLAAGCYHRPMSITIRSSSQEALKDPALLRKELDAGHVLELTDIGAVLTRIEDVHALADHLAEEELREHMASFRKDATGVDNTIWISPKGRTRHAACVKVAIDPPDSLDATSQTASVAVHDGSVTEGQVPIALLRQVQEFVRVNRDILMDYWEGRIDTRQLDQRLQPIQHR
jgi:NAD(P)H-dependent FMN reductase